MVWNISIHHFRQADIHLLLPQSDESYQSRNPWQTWLLWGAVSQGCLLLPMTQFLRIKHAVALSEGRQRCSPSKAFPQMNKMDDRSQNIHLSLSFQQHRMPSHKNIDLELWNCDSRSRITLEWHMFLSVEFYRISRFEWYNWDYPVIIRDIIQSFFILKNEISIAAQTQNRFPGWIIII